MLNTKYWKAAALSIFFSANAFAIAVGGIYTCPGPYSCILPTYLGLQFPDGSIQTTAAAGGGAFTIGAYNTQASSANGATAVGNTLYLQIGTPANPGLTLAPMTALGDITYGGASGVLTKLAGNITNTKKFLAQTGTGAVSAAPSWLQPTFTDIGGLLGVGQGGTGVGSLSSFTDSTGGADGISVSGGSNALIASTSIAQQAATTSLPGYLSAANFTTFNNKTSYTPNNHGVLLSGTAASTANVLAPDASTAKVLVSGGTGSDPSWSLLTNTNLSGSAAITNANLANMASSSSTVGTLKANMSGASAVPSDSVLTSASTASSAVWRDASSNFSAGTITAALTGTASGNTRYTANNHGVVVSGSANVMSVVPPDSATTTVLTSQGTGSDPIWQQVANSSLATMASTSTTSGTVKGNISGAPATPSDIPLENTNVGNSVVYRNGAGDFSTGTITGTLAGNASTATTATSATQVATTSTNTNATFFPLFVASSSNSNQASNLDTNLTYNASTNTLSTTTFSGALTGTASGNLTLASPTNHGVLVSGSANATTATSAGSSGQVLTSNGAAADPTFQTLTPTFSGLTQFGSMYAATTTTLASTAAGSQFQSLIANAGGSAPSFQAIPLAQTAATTGVLPISRGGTNASSFVTGGGGLYYDGTKLNQDSTNYINYDGSSHTSVHGSIDTNYNFKSYGPTGVEGDVTVGTAVATRTLNVNGPINFFNGGTQTVFGGVVGESNASIFDFGANDSSTNRFGGAYTQATQGGFLRTDTRAGQKLFGFFGRVAASTTLTDLWDLASNGDVTHNVGNLTMSSGNLSLTAGTMTSSGTITSTGGNIAATSGNLSAGGTITGTNYVASSNMVNSGQNFRVGTTDQVGFHLYNGNGTAEWEMGLTGTGQTTLKFRTFNGSVYSDIMTLTTAGALTVSSCTGCSVIAEMMPVEDVVEGDAVCIDEDSGAIEKCTADKALTALGIATTHAEQILRMGCSDSTTKTNSLMIGGGVNDHWKATEACKGWYPIALNGVHEFAKVECKHLDGSPMKYGDRLVTSGSRPGFIRPLKYSEAGGDAVIAKAVTLCKEGLGYDVVNVHIGK